MLFFFEAVNIVALLLMLLMLAAILRQQPSRAQTAFILYDIFTMLFVVGVQLELIHSDTVGEALSGLCVQYTGQAGFLLALLWFAAEFARFSIPSWVFGMEAVCDAVVLLAVFTAEKHTLFYSSMKILTDGMYHRIEVTGGIIWKLHYLHLFAVIIAILIFCVVRYAKSSPVQKRRILYLAAGIGALTLELFLKGIGVFGSYNPVVFAMTFTMFCMMMAMIKYQYFGSLHAAVDNAFNHGNEGLIILDEENVIVFINHRMRRIFPTLHKGSTIDDCQEIRRLLEGQEHVFQRGDVSYELRSENIIENGEANGRMLWLIDQTQALLTMQKLREADEAKTQFLMKASHELRTPMNTILGMNEMIQRESGEEKIRKYAKEAAAAGGRMLALIDEVLDTSSLESGRLKISQKPYRICEVLRSAEEMIRPQAEKKGLLFVVETMPILTSEDTVLLGDSVRLSQVLVNLLSNAVKYTDGGLICLHAKLQEAFGQKKQLILSVSDTGIGIPEKEQKRIFENFGRGSNTKGRGGMGLGLAIVRQLIDAMGGKLTVESKCGKGSTFVVSLPWLTEEKKTASELEQSGICMEDGLRYADGSRDFYRQLLQLFVKNKESQQQKLEAFWEQLRNLPEGKKEEQEERDSLLKKWVSLCHGLKGEARGLGAAALGEVFYQLELAGRSGDVKQMEKYLPAAAALWQETAEGIKRFLDEE